MFGLYADVNLHRLTAAGLSAVTILIICFICPQTKASGCKIFDDSGELTANCSNLSLQDIPQNLPPNVQVLDVSSNSIKELKSQTFERYQQLLVINFVNRHYATKIESNAFMRLRALEFLQLDGNDLSKNELSLPINIQILTLSNTKLQQNNINFLELPNLKHLDIENNLFEYLPRINESTPLTLLFMKGNPLRRFSAKQIARFCHLKVFSISNNIEAFTYDPCECPRLKAWMADRNITLDKQPGNDLVCPKGDECKDRNLITPRMKELYDNCETGHTTDLTDGYEVVVIEKKWNSKLLILVLGIAALFIILAAVAFWRINVKSTPKQDKGDVGKEEEVNEAEEEEEEKMDLADKIIANG